MQSARMGGALRAAAARPLPLGASRIEPPWHNLAAPLPALSMLSTTWFVQSSMSIPSPTCGARGLMLSLTSRPVAAHCTAPQGIDSPAAAEPYRKLKAWLIEHDKALPTQLRPEPNSSGHGMVCEERVERGQVLVRIPKSLMMTQDTAKRSPLCGALITESGLNEWQALVLHLLCERAVGEGSFWAPYISTLPDQSQHPLMWGEEQLAMLQGSPMLDAVKCRMQQVQDDCDMLLVAGANDLDVAKQWSQQHGQDFISVQSVGWAAATLLSRAFSLDLVEEEPIEGDMSYFGSWQQHPPDMLALVPWADLLEHSNDAGPESSLAYNAELGAASLASHRQYAAGEQVYGSFGENLSPCDLLLDYGFVEVHGSSSNSSSNGIEGGQRGGQSVHDEVAHDDDESDRPGSSSGSYDRYEASLLDIATPSSSRARTLMAALLKVQGPKARLALTLDGPDSAALSCVRGALASDADLVRAGWRVKATENDTDLACRVMGSLYNPINRENEAKVLKAFKAYIEKQLGAYPTSVEEDEARLADPATPWLARQIILALASEKRSLMSSLEAITYWLKMVEEGAPLETLYSREDSDMEDDVFQA